MERLTIKNSKDIYALNIEANNDLDAKRILMDMFKVACNKLGKLEDLEEQIWMPLDVFVNLSKCCSVVYSIENKHIQIMIIEALFFKPNLLPCGFFFVAYEDLDDAEAYEDLYFSDFNKTWFLTREEAEARLKEVLNDE